MKRATVTSFVAVLLTLLGAQTLPAKTTQTQVTVRALAKGAKFIGSSMEGARITITNLETGEVLAEGKTSGSTGNTDRIMRKKHGRNRVLSTEDSAKYTTILWLDKPTKVKIKAHGPLSNPEDANSASVTRTILPGKDLTGGDAVRLKIPGFVVEILSPTEKWFEGDSPELTVRTKISLMCGCPIKPDGLWDSKDYEIRMAVYQGREMIDEFPLRYSGEPSHFERTITIDKTGCYRIRVYAFDPTTGNTGYETKSCTVSEG